jgi:hypothetical protein
MAQMLMGAFESTEHADRALNELEECGYMPEEISVISSTNKYEREGYDAGGNVAKSAGAGAATGGIIGGLAGLMAGVGVMPALAGLFIGGPIAAALGLVGAAATTASGAVTGAAAGGLIGALTGMGLSKETAASYDRIVTNGGVVIGLSGHNEITAESRAILEKHGARDINVIDMRETSEDTTQTEATDFAAGRQAQPSFGERAGSADIDGHNQTTTTRTDQVDATSDRDNLRS